MILGYLGEFQQATPFTFTIKNHMLNKAHARSITQYNATIIIVRNPYKALLSDFNRHMAKSIKIALSPEQYKSNGKRFENAGLVYKTLT